MIEVHNLTKRYGSKLAVDHLSFTVEPGQVTGFLGPNGAGKSTTMRLILGLDRPQEGRATINGKRYAQLSQPLRTVGALLEARALHPGRSARDHLLYLAQTQGLPRRRVDEVLGLVGLQDVAGKRTKGYSLGMTQRVGIAVAMLGDPEVLLLDEPVNGLDPEGILWIRNLMKQLAAEGRTVLVSSHLMNEMAVTADHLIVIGRGRLIAALPTQEFIERSAGRSVLVRSPAAAELARLITARGGTVTTEPPGSGAGVQPGNGAAVPPGAGAAVAPGAAVPAAAGAAVAPAGDGAAGTLSVTGLEAARVGEIAAEAGIVLHELTPRLASLEEAFMETTAGSLEYGVPASGTPGPDQKGVPVPGQQGVPAPGQQGAPVPGQHGAPAPDQQGVPAPERAP
ncbi:MAG: ATP-binding cassette domain-containing protein [Actinobacteria bacterium]|nr:ATP-binding cassette domain-containing protein [Actinomycetota bacterium]